MTTAAAVVHGYPPARYGRGVSGSRLRSRKTARYDKAYLATKKNVVTASTLSKDPESRKSIVAQVVRNRATDGVQPRFTLAIPRAPQPSLLIAYSTRVAARKELLASAASASTISARTAVLPSAPKIEAPRAATGRFSFATPAIPRT